MTYAGAEFRDQFFRQRRESGHDLDWGVLWTGPFLVPLREAGVRTILELGCGTGNDAARLAREGYSVTAIDLSGEAIEQAQARFGSGCSCSTSTRWRTGRCARAGCPRASFEADYVAEESGQTMHFFFEAYLRELLGGWRELHLGSVKIPHRETGEPFKHVWRGIAHR
ncbi:MAG: class I SAM-dependent methyltransferase [Streptosporangiaceae bacterium]